MGYSTILLLKTGVLIEVMLCSGYLKGVAAQTQNQVIAVEATDVQLTILIPDNELANTASYISIKHNRGTGHEQTEIVFLMNDGPRIKDAYINRLSVIRTGSTVNIWIMNVSAADAGAYSCFSTSSTIVIPECGQDLIIVRKPDPPTVKILQSTTALVGLNLHLVCETHTTSLPSNHGMMSNIFWYDHIGNYIDPSVTGRIHISAEGHLVIESLRRTDRGLKFYCNSADDTGNVATRLVSHPSDVFTVIPEYKPTLGDFKMTPDFDTDETVKKVIGQQVSYRCEAECTPPCQTVWMYRPYGGVAGFGEVMNFIDKKVLTSDVTRINEGAYRCRAENRHGFILKGFYLEALYITTPIVSINGLEKTSARLLEDSQVDLTCVFDSNPQPEVIWSSPTKTTLSTQRAVGSQEKVAESGVYVRPYSSQYSLTHLRCEDSGVYKCEGRNNISTGEGRIHLMFMCPPTSAGIPGLDLSSVYVWDIPQSLVVSFVIRALPEPDITRIISSVKGQSRREELPRDFVISKSKSHDGKAYLTKFILTSRRNLDTSDEGRVFSVTIASSEFTKDFRFTIYPRGGPHEIFNLTARYVGHDSFTLSWTPGFNGGDAQTFSVDLRIQNPRKLTDEPQKDEYHWTSVAKNISDEPVGKMVDVLVGSLKSSTAYVVRVTAMNKLGTAVTEIEIKTAVAPDDTMGAGAIIGIIIAVLIITAIIAAVIYFIIYKRSICDNNNIDDDDEKGVEKETDEARKSMIPERIITLFKRGRSKGRRQAGTSDVGDDKQEDDTNIPIFKPAEEDHEKHVHFLQDTF